jgi:imidazolonepropionase-like amidohydrolase
VTETNERFFDERVAAETAERGIVVCPTINVNAPYVTELIGVPVGENVRRMWEMGVRIIAGTDAGIDNTPHHQYAGGLAAMVSLLGFRPVDVITMATTEAAAALGLGAVTGRLAPGYEADLIVVDGDPLAGDPLAGIAALGRLRRVVARGRDYVPDSGRFDVSAPGTPFASPDHSVGLRLLREATRLRQPGGRVRPSGR